MIKILLIFFLTISALVSDAQSDISAYLSNHHYSFSLDKGFDQSATDSLKQKLSGYKLILQDEASHLLSFEKRLRVAWIKFLNENFGLTHFFVEWGHGIDMQMNKYLQTGDTSNFRVSYRLLSKSLYAYNSSLPPGKKLRCFGVDFERPIAYIKALQSILSNIKAPEDIEPAITLLRNANGTLDDCDYIININEKLKKYLSNHKHQFVDYFGDYYIDFERMVLNKGNCQQLQGGDRNEQMASTFLSFDKEFNQSIYYGQLGQNHTILKNRNTASILNSSAGFEDKVCVINTYCYNCTTSLGQVSGGMLKKLEKDILAYFLPYCTTDFTLFDLSENLDLVNKYRAYGQFLLIAKNQKD